MAGFVQSLGLDLVDRSGKPFNPQQLTSADVIAFYFSAQRCPPCQHFTPMLKKYVETLEAHGEKSLKVIFVSSDKSEHDMWEYMYQSHGNWLALSYNCAVGKERLNKQYHVSGIPALIVIDQLGRHAVRDARSDVMSACQGASTQVLTSYLTWKTASGASAGPPAGLSAATCSQLEPEARVRIRGLTGAPEHNGEDATVKGFDAGKQRYVVELPGQRQLSLKVANLLQRLRLKLRSADAGGLEMDLVDYEEESRTLILRPSSASDQDDAEILQVKLEDPDGPILPSGTRVAVQGLKAASFQHWNECNGKILEFDDAVGRYLVQMDATSQLKIKSENLRIFPLS